MYIPVQKNIHCEPCKKCGARPVIEQLPNFKFRILCPTDMNHYKSVPGLVDIEAWNKENKQILPLRKVG
jgi:hypothetical protein